MRTPGMRSRRALRPALRPALLLLLIAPAAALGACGADEDPTAVGAPPGAVEQPEAAVVSIEQSRYEPRTVAVPAGSEITFRNLDAAAHTVTSTAGGPAAFDSGDLGEGEELVVRVDEPGTYEYLCEIHPTMRGTVVVE